MAYRYTIDVEKYIPPTLRELAKGLGATDLANFNPLVTLFGRPRDATYRFTDPKKYSPTGKREKSDLYGMFGGVPDTLLSIGLGKLLKQPAKDAFTSLFGLGSPQADPKAIARQEARDARRFRAGFDIDAYHGQADVGTAECIITNADGKEFGVFLEPDFTVPSVKDENLGINAFLGTKDKFDDAHPTSLGTWFGDDPDIANYFAGSGIEKFDDGVVYPVKLLMDNPKEFATYDDLEDALYDFIDEGLGGTQEFVKSLQDKNFDGIKIDYSTTDTGNPRSDYVIFDPTQVRSRFAKFDPKKASSRNIMNSIVAAVGAGAALKKSEEDTPKY